MPVLNVRTPPGNERELLPISMSATSAAATFAGADLASLGTGAVYVSAAVTNNSSGTIQVVNNRGAITVIQPGQSAEVNLEGATWFGVIPTAATTAGQVVIVPFIREPM